MCHDRPSMLAGVSSPGVATFPQVLGSSVDVCEFQYELSLRAELDDTDAFRTPAGSLSIRQEFVSTLMLIWRTPRSQNTTSGPIGFP